MKRIIMSVVLCSLFLFVNQSYAEMNGDIESIDFDVKTENSKVKMLNSTPMPAIYSATDWIGLADTDVFKLGSSSYNKIFDNNANTYLTWSSLWTMSADFVTPIAVGSYRLSYNNVLNSTGGNLGGLALRFYNGSKMVKEITLTIGKTAVGESKIATGSVEIAATRVELVVTRASVNMTSMLYELEFYTDEAITYESINDISAIADLEKIDVTYSNPDSVYLTKNIIKLDGVEVYNGPKKSNHSFLDLKEKTKYKIDIGAVYYNATEVWSNIEITTKSTTPEPPAPITELTASFIDEQIILTFKKPPDADYLLIYKNGKLITDKHITNNYIDKDYEIGKKYTYRVVAVNDGGRSPGVSAILEIPTKEITNLRAATTEKDVELFWNLPVYSDFELVSIYRKDEKGLMPKMKMLFSAGDGYSHIFMTNGTYFKDMTVAADRGYEYKLTTLSKTGDETKGVTVKTKTKPVMITGSDLIPADPDSEKSDYVLNWATPKTGKIKILMDGKEYKTIDAAALTHTIPAADIVIGSLGTPNVKIVPVEDGTGREVGPVVIPGKMGFEVDVPIDAGGLLGTGVALLGVIGGFVLLGLAFRVVPKLIRTIRKATEGGKVQSTGRRMNND